ncbi:hypothetical protein [Actinokineospora terrae]|uniref:Uncharacterized protein n=1 Tax=Actinokineospora terrae TaxID=155974 RepID=A0A1H9XH87_9PSEU|nr:hypothetical protein [Actinokineospora terrae]SES45401.1 hypothetical protein SAMN04487818_11576 [Actinokineospora terrae]
MTGNWDDVVATIRTRMAEFVRAAQDQLRREARQLPARAESMLMTWRTEATSEAEAE